MYYYNIRVTNISSLMCSNMLKYCTTETLSKVNTYYKRFISVDFSSDFGVDIFVNIVDIIPIQPTVISY